MPKPVIKFLAQDLLFETRQRSTRAFLGPDSALVVTPPGSFASVCDWLGPSALTNAVAIVKGAKGVCFDE